jgi:hypothetical protein
MALSPLSGVIPFIGAALIDSRFGYTWGVFWMSGLVGLLVFWYVGGCKEPQDSQGILRSA